MKVNIVFKNGRRDTINKAEYINYTDTELIIETEIMIYSCDFKNIDYITVGERENSAEKYFEKIEN